ncbi:hypothetical protein [Kribbella deserti]|uniref:GNAT family N-acetyltransferase n=1 Tax=Kribbella deserti TaxID=1926257 RepID=A0ABV6QF55_9ACTN
MTSIVVQLLDPLAEPVPAEWDRFAADHQLVWQWSADALRAAAWNSQNPTLLGLATDNAGTPIAVVHARALGLPARPDRFRRGSRFPLAALLEVRRPPGADSGFTFAAGLNVADRREVVDQFGRAVRRYAGRRPFAIAYRHLAREDLAAVCTSRNVAVRVQPRAVLDNEWDAVEDYLAHLHHKRRNSIRRLRRQISADQTLTVATERQIDPEAAARLVELVRMRHRHRGLIEPPIAVEQIELMTRAEGVRFSSYREAESGRLLAFAGWEDTGKAIVNGLWGAEDPAAGGRRNLYFDAAFRSVEALIETGRRQLDMGKGMTDIKESFGARLEPRYLVMGPL